MNPGADKDAAAGTRPPQYHELTNACGRNYWPWIPEHFTGVANPKRLVEKLVQIAYLCDVGEQFADLLGTADQYTEIHKLATHALEDVHLVATIEHDRAARRKVPA